MKKIIAAAFASTAALALAACGSSDKANDDAAADSVEMPAEEAVPADAMATSAPAADAMATPAAADAMATPAVDAAKSAASAAGNAADAAAKAADAAAKDADKKM